MAKAFDATLNSLIDDHLADWANFLAARAGVPTGPVVPLDTDLSATLQADRLFRIDGPTPFALHLELEVTGRLGIPGELLRYNVAAHAATELPIHSVLLLLRPRANATDQTGHHEVIGAAGHPYLTFDYTVVRLWTESLEGILAGGVGLAPLALLTNEAAADLDAAFERFRERLRQPDVPGNVAEALFGPTLVLGGLRYDHDRLVELYRRLSMTLEDSTTYQWIFQQGEARGESQGQIHAAHRLLLIQARQRFGEEPVAEARLQQMTDPGRLERIAARILNAANWDDLLTTP